MLKLFVIPATLSAFLLAPVARDSANAPAPRACPSVQVDGTSPELAAQMQRFSFHSTGTSQVQFLSQGRTISQVFEGIDENGEASAVEVTCTSTGCTAGCITTGCNPITINGQPACSALQCLTSSGTPCGVQGTCTKAVKATGSGSTQ